MSTSSVLVFCDFDGTVAVRDVGYCLFHHFSNGKNDSLIPDWKAGRLSSREILLQEAAMVHAAPDEIFRFLDQFTLDPTFAPFVALCSANNIEPVILSEGMDFYIDHLLRKHNIQGLQVLSNGGRFESGGLTISFPHKNRHCRRCGSCKGERMADFRKKATNDAIIVFVGDGYSDACAAREADIVFAKNDLVTCCEEQDIAYNTYQDFGHVADAMLSCSLFRLDKR